MNNKLWVSLPLSVALVLALITMLNWFFPI